MILQTFRPILRFHILQYLCLQRQCISNIYDDYSTLCHIFIAANNAAAPYLSKILTLLLYILVVYVLQHQYNCGTLLLVVVRVSKDE
jgi:hypothetical protein